jgi:hypothetical protein
MKKVLPLIAAIAVFLVACGPKATPTQDGASIQASAVALAFTMSAQTQIAAPTATQIPTSTPTIPPVPTNTPFVLPTFPVALATSTNVSGDPCNSLMEPNPGGPKVYVMIDNQVKASLSMSLYLSPTPFACGYARLPAIGPNANVGVNLPQGCYFPSAYINDPKKQRAIQGPSACIHGSDKITLTVNYEGFKWIFP